MIYNILYAVLIFHVISHCTFAAIRLSHLAAISQKRRSNHGR